MAAAHLKNGKSIVRLRLPVRGSRVGCSRV